MSKVFFIYDVGPQERLQWLASAFKDKDTEWLEMNYNEKNRIRRWRKIFQFCGYMELAIKTLRKSDRGNFIISWNFIVGAFVAVICSLFRLDRTILSLNMISHEKKGIIAFFRRIVYNYAFSYKKFYFTVNSGNVLDYYLGQYRIDAKKVFVLPDPYLDVYKKKHFDHKFNYVFCGGEAQRDWAIYFEAAKALPDYKFVGVARKKYMPKDLLIPENVEMFFDIKEEYFDDLLEKSSVVALPLSSPMPAGLIVMFKSIQLSKPLILTKTSSVMNYLNSESAVLIDFGDKNALIKGINYLVLNREKAENMACNAQNAIKKYSPAEYSEAIYKILFNQER